MTCQDPLVRQQPCPSAYLFTLGPAGALVTLLSALTLNAFLLGGLLQALPALRRSPRRAARPPSP